MHVCKQSDEEDEQGRPRVSAWEACGTIVQTKYKF